MLSYVNLLSTNQLSCISMNNQECKVRPEIINLKSDEPVNVVVAVTVSIIHMRECVLLML